MVNPFAGKPLYLLVPMAFVVGLWWGQSRGVTPLAVSSGGTWRSLNEAVYVRGSKIYRLSTNCGDGPCLIELSVHEK